MPKKPKPATVDAGLRHRAEARQHERGLQKPSSVSLRLDHELEVHKIELMLQNAELQKTRDELESTLDKYTDLYNFTPVGCFSIAESGEILEANLAGAASLGVKRSQLLNGRFLAFVAPGSRLSFLTFLKETCTENQDHHCELEVLKKGGGTFWASFRATPAVSLKGVRKWCRVAFGDITDRKEAEETLRESEKRYRILFDLFPVAVYSCDASGAIQKFNRRAAELWGREPASGETDERFCGSFKLFRPDGSYMPHEKCPMAEVLDGKIPAVHDGEVIIERPEGSRINVLVNIRPLKNERGEVTGAINCFYDITERKRAEGAQRRLAVLTASNRKLEQEIVRRQKVQESLKQSEQHQGVLLKESRQMQEQLRNLSHQILHAQEEERGRISRELHDEIAQTLVAINAHLEGLILEAKANTRGIPQKIKRTQSLVKKSVDLVHQFARQLRPAVLDNLGLVAALNAFMQEFSKRTGIRVRFTTFTSGKITQLDKTTSTVFYRVAQEALTNVARHARASLAEVKFEKLPGAFCLKIKDNGKSFQAQRVLSSKKNTRLGLLGMRERLEMVGGSFSIESSPGKGTLVQAQIPLVTRREELETEA